MMHRIAGLAALFAVGSCASIAFAQGTTAPAAPAVPAGYAQAAAELERKAELDAQKDHVIRLRATTAGGPTIAMFSRTGKTEKGPFLGVYTAAIQPAMRAQLKLARGVGLVIQTVEPESPAEKAGLKQYDIVEKLDDQILVNPEQLSVLIRMHKPTDTIQLSIIRESQPQTIKATLIEKDLVAMDETTGVNGMAWGTAIAPDATVELVGDEQRSTLAGILKNAVGTTASKKVNMVSKDDKYSLDFTITDGARWLVVNDNDGKEVFHGPVDTADQKKILPVDIAERLVKLEKMIDEDKVGVGAAKIVADKVEIRVDKP